MRRQIKLYKSRELPCLPPELWILILSHNTNLVHLWLDCRQVSTTFRAYAEAAITQYIFPKAKIRLIIQKKEDEFLDSFDFPLCFDRYESVAERHIAVFTGTVTKEQLLKAQYWEIPSKDAKYETFGYRIRMGGNPGGLGPYNYYYENEDASDTEEQELRIDWKESMSAMTRDNFSGESMIWVIDNYMRTDQGLKKLPFRSKLRRSGRQPMVKTGVYRRGVRQSARISKLIKRA